MNLVWPLLFVAVVVIACLAQGAAYRNGVADGYGYGKEPWNPGYRRAGGYLRKHMAHRWKELRQPDGTQVSK